MHQFIGKEPKIAMARLARVRILVTCLLTTVAVWAQDPELGHIDISSYEAVLTVDSPRPMDSVAKTLSQSYGMVINSEDPQYLYRGDMKDVTAETVRTMRPGLRVLVPQGGRLEIRFPVTPEGSPRDVRGLSAISRRCRQRPISICIPFGCG